MHLLKETASQTAGPYVHISLAPGAAGLSIFRQELGQDIADPTATGERIRIEGVMLDGTGAAVKDALLEVWQADAAGIHPHPDDPRHADCTSGFRGWGRVIPDFDTGLWAFDTIKPGAVRGRNGRPMAPLISLWIVTRGINIGLATRICFDDEDNSTDPVLTLIEHPARRETLLARKTGRGRYRFDSRLQGDTETVFLDI